MLFAVAVAVAVALVGSANSASPSIFTPGKDPNKFIVTYSIVPDPFHSFSFYTMPRTIEQALKDKFSPVGVDKDYGAAIWCRENDYRVCCLFDAKGSVAGIQMSVRASELDPELPLDWQTIPEWERQTFMGEDVYTATALFVHPGTLRYGRTIDDNTLTAPDGIYIKQRYSAETSLLHVQTDESMAKSSGFYEQACFFGMGKHYFLDVRPDSKCENSRPYFLLFGPKTKQLTGFGFTMFGKPSKGRGWFENPPAFVAKQIAPNSPDCLTKWINKYGMFTMHVYFVDKPYFTLC